MFIEREDRVHNLNTAVDFLSRVRQMNVRSEIGWDSDEEYTEDQQTYYTLLALEHCEELIGDVAGVYWNYATALRCERQFEDDSRRAMRKYMVSPEDTLQPYFDDAENPS